ncbi:cell division protein FtsQ/DivIB [Cellulomonas sp. P22]|uniref:cell division protein FtsQ/DivIB n=1 Tax=Cellulomonas sp. P22 TaxID=3373189 RepID=UPI00378A7B7A
MPGSATGSTPVTGQGAGRAPVRPRPALPSRPAASEPRAGTGATPQARGAGLPEPSVTTYSTGRRGTVLPSRPPVVSAVSAARFAERARARRRLAVRQVALVVGGLLGVGLVAWLVLFSPVLRLDQQQVVVDGAGTVVAVDQVLAVVAEQGEIPLPRLDTVALREQVLDVPGVREAEVTREWPRGLHIQLVSREPVAAVPEEAGVVPPDGVPGFALVDMDGVQVGRVDVAPEGLPVVQVPVGEARTLTAVLTVLDALPVELLAQVGEVSAQTQDTVTMQLRDGARVDWGSEQDTALKIAVLGALRAAPESAGAAVYDVSAPTMPITR